MNTHKSDSNKAQWLQTVSRAGGLNLRIGPPLVVLLFPRMNLAGKLLLSGIFVGLLVLFSVGGRIPLPDNPVPITLQTFGVVLAGGVMGWRWGIFIVATYYLLGLLDLPVFARPDAEVSGGIAYVSGATGGYLLGFMMSAGLVGLLSQLGVNRWKSLWAVLAGSVIVYLPGLIWLSFFISSDTVLENGFYPFVFGDVMKTVTASLILGALWMVVDKRNVKRSADGAD